MRFNKNLVEVDGVVYRYEPQIENFMDFYEHIRDTGFMHPCPNCKKENSFQLIGAKLYGIDKFGGAEYKCKRLFCGFNFLIEPSSKERGKQNA